MKLNLKNNEDLFMRQGGVPLGDKSQITEQTGELGLFEAVQYMVEKVPQTYTKTEVDNKLGAISTRSIELINNEYPTEHITIAAHDANDISTITILDSFSGGSITFRFDAGDYRLECGERLTQISDFPEIVDGEGIIDLDYGYTSIPIRYISGDNVNYTFRVPHTTYDRANEFYVFIDGSRSSEGTISSQYNLNKIIAHTGSIENDYDLYWKDGSVPDITSLANSDPTLSFLIKISRVTIAGDVQRYIAHMEKYK